jgi:hypothetical protein
MAQRALISLNSEMDCHIPLCALASERQLGVAFYSFRSQYFYYPRSLYFDRRRGVYFKHVKKRKNTMI